MESHKRAFVEKVAEYAVSDYQRTRILPSLTLAQAILESNWGESGLAKNSKNLFGVKAGSSWTGKRRAYPTKEFLNGAWVTVTADFREYDTFEGSIRDHNDLLNRPRYAKVRGETDYKKATTEVWRAGYATDPDYPKKLQRLIERLKLTVYDEKALGTGKKTAPIPTAKPTAKPTPTSVPLSRQDAGRIISYLQDCWSRAGTVSEKSELNRLANAIRQHFGDKTQ